MVEGISPDLMLSSAKKREAKTGNDILGKDDFLKLLMTQLKNQDPTNPMQDREFISQMATFSSLEQMTNMNQAIQKMVQLESQSSLIAFQDFVGKEITWHKLNENAEPGENAVTQGTGVVKTIRFMEDTVKLILEDGTELLPANVSEVNSQSTETPLMQASALIGKDVSWMADEKEQSDTVASVSLKDGIVSLVLSNGETIKTNQLTKIG